MNQASLKGVLGLILWLFVAGDGQAWSARGHAAISLSVYRQLPENAASRYLEYAEKVKSISHVRLVNSYKFCKKNIAVCDLAVWPDRIRELPLERLFKSLKVSVPEQLVAYRNSSTAPWHYENAYYSPAEQTFISHCKFAEKGDLSDVIPRLQAVLESDASESQQALVLAFWVHLVSDAHQPLHTLTKIDRACHHDFGGNKSCVAPEVGRCKLNLHQLWDSGGDIFFSELRPLEVHDASVAVGIQSIRQEIKTMAPAVYLKHGHYNSPSYREYVQLTSNKQARLAATRIAQYLARLWSS